MKEARKYLVAFVATILLVGVLNCSVCALAIWALGTLAGGIGYFISGLLTAWAAYVFYTSLVEEYRELKKLLEKAEEEP